MSVNECIWQEIKSCGKGKKKKISSIYFDGDNLTGAYISTCAVLLVLFISAVRLFFREKVLPVENNMMMDDLLFPVTVALGSWKSQSFHLSY